MNREPSVHELKLRKESLIREWMRLQEEMERTSEAMYYVTCQIEAINLAIREEKRKKKRLRRDAASGGGEAANGRAGSPQGGRI